MPRTDLPYGAFNFQVSVEGGPRAGFSDVSGLGTELMVAEYRNGDDPENHVQKVAGLHKVSDVTLKRGIINQLEFYQWINEVHGDPSVRKDVTITLIDESQNPVMTWKLIRCIPQKWTGPTLAAKAHGDVAMEEIVLAIEGMVLPS
ncbi:MAG: phage tail protein [Myxococcales bacterium]|nr:phage tail protein [Myxococcales bacterium]